MVRFSLYFLVALFLPLWSGLLLVDSQLPLVNPDRQLPAASYNPADGIAVGESAMNGSSSSEMTPDRARNAERFYPGDLPGTFTGGFGEESCRSCHFDYEANPPGGSLTVTWPPESFVPGEEYAIQVSVASERLAKGGFQMSARYQDGSQAGSFSWEGDRLRFTLETGTDSLQYLQHSAAGTAPTSEKRVAWEFVWTAPESPSGPVMFNIAANAGNDDLSPFGDWIYIDEFLVVPAGK